MKKLNHKPSLMTSTINNLIISSEITNSFQNIIVPNLIISGECKLYKDNVHVANIVFQVSK